MGYSLENEKQEEDYGVKHPDSEQSEAPVLLQ